MSDLQKTKEQLINLLARFDTSPKLDLRSQVLELIPAWEKLRALGTGLIPHEVASAARDRILHYFLRYPQTVISHREIMVVSGISEWARRVRELRKEMGWAIISGTAAKEMQEAGEIPVGDGIPDCSEMRADDYVMFDTEQDREAAFRWKIANEIRRNPSGAKASILEYLKRNIGRPVHGDELQYVANGRTEWARRVRELRTEDGWQISTHWSGRPELKPGIYLLESDRQLPAHDRIIPDPVRRSVLVRDNYTCQDCGWTREQWNQDDPRHLELHHLEHHVDGGTNTEDNLVTLCNVCHDQRH